MGVIALFSWLITAGGGLYLLAVWLIEYDRDFQRSAATRLPIPVLGGHVLLAAAGLVVWAGYLISDNRMLAWAAVAILGGVAALGLTMVGRWLGVRRSSPARPAAAGARSGAREHTRASAPPVPPERHFPVTVVVAHGVFALATVTLVVATALAS
jgi:manganese efflux pump family protein